MGEQKDESCDLLLTNQEPLSQTSQTHKFQSNLNEPAVPLNAC
jgi:hypothetical protein